MECGWGATTLLGKTAWRAAMWTVRDCGCNGDGGPVASTEGDRIRKRCESREGLGTSEARRTSSKGGEKGAAAGAIRRKSEIKIAAAGAARRAEDKKDEAVGIARRARYKERTAAVAARMARASANVSPSNKVLMKRPWVQRARHMLLLAAASNLTMAMLRVVAVGATDGDWGGVGGRRWRGVVVMEVEATLAEREVTLGARWRVSWWGAASAIGSQGGSTIRNRTRCGFSGIRIGEAKVPGPYSEGGASGSGGTSCFPSQGVKGCGGVVRSKGRKADLVEAGGMGRWPGPPGTGGAGGRVGGDSAETLEGMQWRDETIDPEPYSGGADARSCSAATTEAGGSAGIQVGRSGNAVKPAQRISPRNLYRQLQEQTAREQGSGVQKWTHLGLARTKKGANSGVEGSGHGEVEKAALWYKEQWKSLEEPLRASVVFPSGGVHRVARYQDRLQGSAAEPSINEEKREQDGSGAPRRAGGQSRTISLTELARAKEAKWAAAGWGRKGNGIGGGSTGGGRGRPLCVAGHAEGSCGFGTQGVRLREERTRPRGRRGRGGVACEHHFMTMNTSGRPQLLENLDRLQARGARTCAILNQEHQQWKRDLGELQQQAGGAGWKLGVVPAVVGPKGGASAGVAVVVRKGVGFDRVLGGWSGGSGEADGRVAVAWVQAVTKAGILVISVYLWTNEGLAARNLKVLVAAAIVIDRHGGPWLMRGDFNMTPEELQRGAGWDWGQPRPPLVLGPSA